MSIKRIDYKEAREYYIKGEGDEYPSLYDVAREFKYSLSTLRKKAANEGWLKKRKERISNIGTSIKLTPEVHHSSDELLVISVLQEWDTGKGIVMWFVKFRDGKAIQQITAKGDPA